MHVESESFYSLEEFTIWNSTTRRCPYDVRTMSVTAATSSSRPHRPSLQHQHYLCVIIELVLLHTAQIKHRGPDIAGHPQDVFVSALRLEVLRCFAANVLIHCVVWWKPDVTGWLIKPPPAQYSNDVSKWHSFQAFQDSSFFCFYKDAFCVGEEIGWKTKKINNGEIKIAKLSRKQIQQ